MSATFDIMAHKFHVVEDAGWNRGPTVKLLYGTDTLKEAIEKARTWAVANPGQKCFVIERHRLVASDALREEA